MPGAREGTQYNAKWLDNYLMLPATVENVVERLVPTAVTAPMITTEISAAIRPYSMAVAPLVSIKKLLNVLSMKPTLFSVVATKLAYLGVTIGGKFL